MLVGVDWGGTKIEAIAIADDGRPITRSREATPRSDYEGCLSTIASLVSRVEGEAGTSGSVGIGIPGSVDPRTGIAKGASSTWLNGKPVEADLRRALGREVKIANDADCFAVSEAVDGAGTGHNVVFAVILGSGAGAGVAIGGKAHHGPNNSAGEWGHVDRVARGLSVVVNTLDPDILVLGGGMANIDELYDELPPRLAEETFSPCFYTPIVGASHGDSSGVRGAAWLWR
jgi:predicted NBD/HSP70 family sugar kinase